MWKPFPSPEKPPLPRYESIEDYIDSRVWDQVHWYSTKAKRCKRWYVGMQILTVVLAAFLPATTIASHQLQGGSFWLVPTSLGIFVGLLASIESVVHLREQWKNYRSTEQILQQELVFYRMKSGPYAGKNARAPELFVNTCEAAIRSENNATLNALTTPVQTPATAQTDDSSGRPEAPTGGGSAMPGQ